MAKKELQTKVAERVAGQFVREAKSVVAWTRSLAQGKGHCEEFSLLLERIANGWESPDEGYVWDQLRRWQDGRRLLGTLLGTGGLDDFYDTVCQVVVDLARKDQGCKQCQVCGRYRGDSCGGVEFYCDCPEESAATVN